MKKQFVFMTLLVLGFTVSMPSFAAKCTAPKAPSELSDEEMNTLYDCLRPKFLEGYGKKGHEVGAAYGDWKAGSSKPAAPGVHSGQHLMTYVNDVGYDQYVEYRTDGSEMPIGTVIAKENFKISDSGKVKIGALLIMTKVGESAENTGGWEYTGVKLNGKNLKVDAEGFCHACHQAWASQDYQGYPLPDARISAN